MKETTEQQTNNSPHPPHNPHSHTSCHCGVNHKSNSNSHHHMNMNDQNTTNNNSLKKRYFLEKFCFIPIILLKIFTSFFLYEKYYSYNSGNKLDVNYTQIAFAIYVLYILILYLTSILSSAEQTNVDKYTPLNTNKRELFKLKQSLLLCFYCHKIKFSRSSHCRVCNKCISFRDHHCPFVTNCIGFNNMQYFINFSLCGSNAIIYIIYCYFKFKYINLSLLTKIIINVDFIGNLFFLLTLIGIIFRCVVVIYNNRTYLESLKQMGIEVKMPIYDCFKKRNEKALNNGYNIGFLKHFFYVIGPTLLHFFFPLPKFKNYTLDENCPIFTKAKGVERLHSFKYNVNKIPNYIKEQIDMPTNPDSFIQLSHFYYDGKIIK